jgi:hypothetical protein
VWPLSGHIKPPKYVRLELRDPDLVEEWDIANILKYFKWMLGF